MTREEAERAISRAVRDLGLLKHMPAFIDTLERSGVVKLESDEEIIYKIIGDAVHNGHKNNWRTATVAIDIVASLQRCRFRITRSPQHPF